MSPMLGRACRIVVLLRHVTLRDTIALQCQPPSLHKQNKEYVIEQDKQR